MLFLLKYIKMSSYYYHRSRSSVMSSYVVNLIQLTMTSPYVSLIKLVMKSFYIVHSNPTDCNELRYYLHYGYNHNKHEEQ